MGATHYDGRVGCGCLVEKSPRPGDSAAPYGAYRGVGTLALSTGMGLAS